MGITPDYAVTANGTSITRLLRDRLISISVTDKAGFEGDSCSITLEADDLELVQPSAVLVVSMGYKETGLVEMGRYAVDEVEEFGPPDQIRIKAKAAPVNHVQGSLQSRQNRTFNQVQFGSLVASIAALNGLEWSFTPATQNITIARVDQKDESDLNMLTWLALDVGAIVTVKNNVLVARMLNESSTASGAALPTTTIARTRCTSWSFSHKKRDGVQSVVASYRSDPGTSSVTVGSGQPVHRIEYSFANETEATQAARSYLQKRRKGEKVCKVTIKGDPALIAEQRVRFTGFREAGTFAITSLTHTISGVYTTTIDGDQVVS